MPFDLKNWDKKRQEEDIEYLYLIYPFLERNLIAHACDIVKSRHPNMLGSWIIARIILRVKPYYREFGAIVVDYL